MKAKNYFTVFIIFLIFFIICDISANILKLRPLLWKNSFYSYLNNSWDTWHGADHLFENEIHSMQKNIFGHRGQNPNLKLKNNIILVGDSYVETSHKLIDMPENILRKKFKNTNVISLGSWGWSTDQQYIKFRNKKKIISKPIVVLWFQMNDLSGNITKHGFLGSKHIFKLKKKNNNWHLSEPKILFDKNYFEYSYFYRAINKILLRTKLIKEKKIYDFSSDCKNYTKKKEINFETLKHYFNQENYNMIKEISQSSKKPYENLKSIQEFPSFREWQNKNIKNYLKYVPSKSLANGYHIYNEDMKFNRTFISEIEKESEIITNLILRKFEKEVQSVNGKFIIFFVKKKQNQPFPNNKTYSICIDDKKFTYNNNSFDQKLDRIFKNLENVFILDLKNYNEKHYDLFDGHYNQITNEFIMNNLYTHLKSNFLIND